MTIHYLRTENNDTVAEIQCYVDDLSVVVDIRQYSAMLLQTALGSDWEDAQDPNDDSGREILVRRMIEDFGDLQEARDVYFECGHSDIQTPREFAQEFLKPYAVRYSLGYTED